MALPRRHFLSLTSLGLCSCDSWLKQAKEGVFGTEIPSRLEPASGEEVDADFHFLSRASFGIWPGELGRMRKIGREAWLEEQLHPERLDDLACDLRAERFESLYFSAGDAYEFRKPVLRDEISRHTLLRAIYSRRQLFEVMVEFWTDHLNIHLEKGDCIYLKPSDDRDVVRRHALGKFSDLIRASATSPAMLVYLDGKSNRVRKGTNEKPNENYARELLELHTLGVNGGYTQQDVFEVARCLSGWTFDSKRFLAMNPSEAFFRPDWHDDGGKVVLGQRLPAGGGAKDLDRVIEILCRHPSTARYLSLKLCRRFVSAEPAESLVAKVAAEFTRTDGHIPSLLRVIFRSEEFTESRGQLLKRPLKWIISSLRALGADVKVEKALFEPLQRMGQGLFQHPTPDGYPDEETPWLGGLLWRWNFALALASNEQKGVQIHWSRLRSALGPDKADWYAYFIGRRPNQAELQAIQHALPERTLGLILASPAFQRC